MAAKVFDGKGKAQEILEEVASRVKRLPFAPKIVSFYKPEDPGSALYTRIKREKARAVGIDFQEVEIEDIQRAAAGLSRAAEDPGVSGILVQNPTGEFSFSAEEWEKLVSLIPAEKDIDGLRENSTFMPATVRAIMVALAGAGVTTPALADKKIAVVGASGMVGKPLVKILKEAGATVREIDNQTEDMWYQTKKADVLISATGVPRLINGDMIKKGAVVVDVGSPGGDVDFESALAVASFITPVPGGIGPLTVACLLENVVDAAEKV